MWLINYLYLYIRELSEIINYQTIAYEIHSIKNKVSFSLAYLFPANGVIWRQHQAVRYS